MRHLVGCTLVLIMLNAHADTVLKWYRPFGEPTDQVTPVAKHQVKAICNQPSQRTLREDALRCEAGEHIFDPCFFQTRQNRTTILCLQSPWDADATEVELQGRLPIEAMQALDMSKNYPWALELGDGSHCLAVDPGRSFDGMPIRYQCNNHKELMGYLRRCQSTWSILEKKGDGAIHVDIARAWF